MGGGGEGPGGGLLDDEVPVRQGILEPADRIQGQTPVEPGHAVVGHELEDPGEGDHGIAVMAAREGIDFETQLVSDSAPRAIDAASAAALNDGVDDGAALARTGIMLGYGLVTALKLASLCGHGTGLARFAESILRYYPSEVEPCFK